MKYNFDKQIERRGTNSYKWDLPKEDDVIPMWVAELKGLGMNVTLFDQQGESIDMDALAKEALIEERKVNSAIRNLTSPREEQPDVTAATEVENDQVSEEGLSVTNGPAKSGDEE